MNALLQDFRFPFRTLANSPGFSSVAILILAFAIGANSAVFSLVNAAVFRPIMPPDVVSLHNGRQGADRDYRRFSYAEYELLKASREVFTDVAAAAPARAGLGRTREDSQQRSIVQLVSANYFSLLGTTPARGRFFTPEEARPNAAVPVIVASHALWLRLGGGSDFLGSTLWVNGQACTVVGIARETFNGASAFAGPELWLPLGMWSNISSTFSRARIDADLGKAGNPALLLLGQLAPGVNLAGAHARAASLAAGLSALQAAGSIGERDLKITVPSRFNLGTQPADNGELMLLAVPMLFMAASVLLIACLNLANMFLARGTARAKEIAVRLALGATRWQIVRQLLVEGLLLSTAGGALGLVFSIAANHALVASLTATLEQMANVSLALDPRPDALVLSFTLAVCVGATLLFSLAPALRASRRDVVSGLKAGSTDTAQGGWNRLFSGRNLLVTAQIALSLVLLFSAALFLRGALKAGNIPLGFDPSGTTITQIDFSLRNSSLTEDRRNLSALLARLHELPNVAGAAVTTQAPMCNSEDERRVSALGTENPELGENLGKEGTNALFAGITPGLFPTLAVPLLRGRDFSEAECFDASAPRVAIIDASLAAKLFPAGDALGRNVRMTGDSTTSDAFEIIGIVGEHRHEMLEVDSTYRVFVPFVHGYRGDAHLLTRARDAQPERVVSLLSTVRAELQQFDATLPVLTHEPYAEFIQRDHSFWSAKIGAVVFGFFGAIALFLAVIGVYSVKAYAIACRTREFGIRLALGARPTDVLGLVVKEGAKQIAVASVIGVGLALLVGKMLTALLFHISPADPLALGGTIFVLGSATLFACYLPARRATQINPLEALRSE